jgi:hypothetical protein
MKCLATFLLLLGFAGAAQAQSVILTNTMDEPIYFWVWKSNRWDQPTYFARNARRQIDLSIQGQYYMVIQDLLKRELKLGWADLHEFGGTELAIDVLYETRGKADALAVGDGLITYGWNPTERKQPIQVALVPYIYGQSVVECVDRFEINPATGDAIKRQYHSVRTPLIVP